MCNCKNEEFMIENNQLCVWDEEMHEYYYSSIDCHKFCPICGENLQPESSKREDVFFIKGSNECIAIDAIPSKECREYHKNSYLQINGKLKRCGTPNPMET